LAGKARSVSSSLASGYPYTARISSPTELITAPPQCVMTLVQMSWNRRMVLPKSSGSKLAASAGEPTSPQDNTVTCRLPDSECGEPAWPGALVALTPLSPDWLSHV